VARNCPLILDLNNDGVKSTSISDGVLFDLDASGTAERTGWVDRHDGLLALDRNGNGTIDSGAELFGNHTSLSSGDKAANGFIALADFDSNADGIISSADQVFSELRVWVDANQNGVSDAGELSTLASLGIAELGLSYTDGTEIQNGNLLGQLGTYKTTDGQSHELIDVWFATAEVPTAASGADGSAAEVPELASMLQPEVSLEALLTQAGFGGATDGAPTAATSAEAQWMQSWSESGERQHQAIKDELMPALSTC
jgi:hypothetical protein